MQEDFQSLTYGFKLAHNVTELRVSGMLKEVEEEYNRRIKVGYGACWMRRIQATKMRCFLKLLVPIEIVFPTSETESRMLSDPMNIS